ncbi:zinc finger BED domain-containing protein RICESLEEPER 2-like [Canna indica]|uniref:Zinc finger BED domain-containing protein RICESLEEPER 2-like n=1 Tax=Canna indica TaxID=4628 RepID=A0AAQ3QTE4_9LILI|nr:zinc finger BED domain-containing protein RICESLEEPER 2-like [Canna indica]
MREEENVYIEVPINDDAMNDIEKDVDEATSTNLQLKITNKGKGKKRKERSKVWTQFDKLSVSEDGIEKFRCKYCLMNFTCRTKSGTSHLLRHMESCKKRDTRNISKMFSSSGQSTMFEKFRELVVSAMVMHNLPFQFVEYEDIRACFQYLRPGVQYVSRNTAKADVLKLYELQKKKMKSMLAMTPSRVTV